MHVICYCEITNALVIPEGFGGILDLHLWFTLQYTPIDSKYDPKSVLSICADSYNQSIN